VKTAISIPDPVFRSAERLAARLGISRSELYSKAVATLLEKHRDEVVTSRLNEIYGPDGESSSLDAELAALQHRTLAKDRR
jgi:metal-responsive CopG/Arc/MetJ family transcriptional regulator